MKKGLVIFSLLLISLVSVSFVSANIFSDFWNKITGKATSTSLCGNGVIDLGEYCDGNNLGRITSCTKFSLYDGELKCTFACRYNASMCLSSPAVAEEPTQENPDNTNDGWVYTNVYSACGSKIAIITDGNFSSVKNIIVYTK